MNAADGACCSNREWRSSITCPATFATAIRRRRAQSTTSCGSTSSGPMARYWWRKIRRAFGTIVDFGPDNPVAPLMLSIAGQYTEGLLRDSLHDLGGNYTS